MLGVKHVMRFLRGLKSAWQITILVLEISDFSIWNRLKFLYLFIVLWFQFTEFFCLLGFHLSNPLFITLFDWFSILGCFFLQLFDATMKSLNLLIVFYCLSIEAFYLKGKFVYYTPSHNLFTRKPSPCLSISGLSEKHRQVKQISKLTALEYLNFDTLHCLLNVTTWLGSSF